MEIVSKSYLSLLLIQTKMRNVAGIGQTESQKASDLYMKCRYIDRITGGRGNTFATGTPISNTLSEMYTMQRYLQYGELRKRGLEHFDSWASVFAETKTELELAITGKGYRTKTRLASYHNLPELTTMFAEFADVQTAEMLNLPVPKIKGGKVKTIALKPSDIQKKMVETLEVRSERISRGEVPPEVDNNLSLTNDGRKLALDVRLIDSLLPDDPGNKVNECANNVYRIWNDTSPIKGTQLVFSDLSTPHGEEDFSVYTDLKAKLVARGVPAKEIEFIHNAKTDIQKEILFGKVRSGNIRVLIGSTAKMGAGTNVQRLLFALHHLDVPWRPRDLEQREGRILRQGNKNDEVEIIRYVTEGTFDSYNYQIVEHKQRFISQIMTNKPPARRMDDVDSATLSYAEVKAIASGNPKIKEKMELDIYIAKLQVLRSQHRSQQYRLQNVIAFEIPGNIKYEEDNLGKLRADRQSCAANTGKEFCIWVGGMKLTEKAAAGDALKSMAKQVKEPDKVFAIGEYSGFPVGIRYDTFNNKHYIVIRGRLDHTIEMSDSSIGQIQRLDNLLHGLDDRIQRTEQKIQKYKKDLSDAIAEKDKPFQFEAELSEKLERVTALNIELSMDKPDAPVLLDEEQIEISDSCGPVFDEGHSKEQNGMAQAYAALKNENAGYNARQTNERER